MRNYTYPIIDSVRTGENIKKLRKEIGMSVKEMQTLFDFNSTQAIYKWQWGRTLPTIDEFIVLARLFNKPIEKILVVGVE